jgi:hypothetical protein
MLAVLAQAAWKAVVRYSSSMALWRRVERWWLVSQVSFQICGPPR